MRIIQGTIPFNYSCNFVRDENKKLKSLSFYKADSKTIETALGAVVCAFLAWVGYMLGSELFFVGLLLTVGLVVMAFKSYIKQSAKIYVNDKENCFIYKLEEITDVKIVDKTTLMAATKGAIGTLGGAAIGGSVFGEGGAIVGALAGGNNIKKEKETTLGIGFSDGNWVVMEFVVNDTMLGRVHQAILNELLQITALKQARPF